MDLKALRQITCGLYVITSIKEGKFNGQIANTVFQVTSEPTAIAVSINKQNPTYSFIRDSHVYTVSVLFRDAPLSFIGNFGFKSGRDIDKFATLTYELGKNGAPIVMEHTLSYM